MKTTSLSSNAPEANLAEYYARRAAEYERIYQKPERQADLRRLRRFVEHTFEGCRVLEIACGTGYWTEVLARTVSSVTGVDVNEEMLEIARSKGINPQKAEFVRGDANALPRLRGPFEAALAAFWWSHVPKSRLAEFLRQFHGVLHPGALVAFIDNAYVEGSSTPIVRADTEGNTYQERRLEDGSTFEVLKNFPSAEELQEIARPFAERLIFQRLDYYWVLKYALRS